MFQRFVNSEFGNNKWLFVVSSIALSVSFFVFTIKCFIRSSFVRQLLTSVNRDFIAFENAFHVVLRDMTTHSDPGLKPAMDRLDMILRKTVPFGKKIRGFAVVKTFQLMAKKEDLTPFNVLASQVVGWCLEIMQAAFLIYDDIMDNSITRRGRKCWHLEENVGVLATNDFSFLLMTLYGVFKKYLSRHPCYHQILDVYYNVKFDTFLGQVTDALTTPEDQRPDFKLFNRERYATIVKYKTSLYSFVTPVKMGMYLAKITDENIHQKAESILMKIGHLFQVQDDYLDIYGDPNVTGKIGTDIEDGKCSWIAVEAYRKMNEEEKQIFENNYAIKNPESIRAVKDVFSKLGMKDAFMEFEEKEYTEIRRMISDLNTTCQLNVAIFEKLLDSIYKRQK